jgi:hypothetical protein
MQMGKLKLSSLITIIFLQTLHANAQQFKNLDFSQKCDTSKTGLCNWDLSWGAKGSIQPHRFEKTNSIIIEGKAENSVGFTEQTSSYNSTSIFILSISASIRTDSVIGKGAGLNIGLYNDSGQLIANKDMGGFYSVNWIKGNKGWKNYSLSIVCPADTRKIKIGAILYGKGKAWFRDYRVEINSIENRKPSKLANEYIGAALDSIQKHSLFRDSINIRDLKQTALKIAGNAKTYSDCYLAVNFLLESLRPLGDEHSFFMTAQEVKNWENSGSQVSRIEFPSYKIIDSCGYILVPPFHGGNQKQILAYADTLQSAIHKIYGAAIKGWIIDLRENTGGNMSPMIAGLGPLFSQEKLGSLIDVNGKPESWYYKEGKYYWDNDTGWKVTKPVQLPVQLPIAVLTGGQTGSSGEAVVISFIGNTKTKFFGQPTWGLTTGNGSFKLKNGSQIFLASTIMADRNGKLYYHSIQPDVLVDDKNENLIKIVVKWISENNNHKIN